jgi:hypothetical protein
LGGIDQHDDNRITEDGAEAVILAMAHRHGMVCCPPNATGRACGLAPRRYCRQQTPGDCPRSEWSRPRQH